MARTKETEKPKQAEQPKVTGGKISYPTENEFAELKHSQQLEAIYSLLLTIHSRG